MNRDVLAALGYSDAVTGKNAQKFGPEAEAIAKVLREMRGGARLKQRELAERSGLSRTAIMDIESGQHVVSTFHLERIAAVYGVKASEIMARAGY